MSTWSVDRAATELLDAQDTPAARGPLSDDWQDLDLRTAYAIQDETLCRRVERGEHVVGIKLGLTSRAKQQRMGISSPLVAWLTDAMTLPAGAPVPGDELIHPRAEPELVFVMKERLAGPGVTALRAMSAVGRVHAGIEIIDSRYRDFRFTLPDVVADNASSARYSTGSIGLAPEQLDLALEACLVEVDGVIVDSATGSAVQGHPAEALALAANTLAERGLAIEPGWIVFTGGMTDAVPVGPGTAVRVHFSHLGSLVVHRGK
ncbi:fumarylacetoacetate hydrolase family protein [soil metagenome]|jgi:2-oxo-3-hexenedioate decarboxylase